MRSGAATGLRAGRSGIQIKVDPLITTPATLGRVASPRGSSSPAEVFRTRRTVIRRTAAESSERGREESLSLLLAQVLMGVGESHRPLQTFPAFFPHAWLSRLEAEPRLARQVLQPYQDQAFLYPFLSATQLTGRHLHHSTSRANVMPCHRGYCSSSTALANIDGSIDFPLATRAATFEPSYLSRLHLHLLLLLLPALLHELLTTRRPTSADGPLYPAYLYRVPLSFTQSSIIIS